MTASARWTRAADRIQGTGDLDDLQMEGKEALSIQFGTYTDAINTQIHPLRRGCLWIWGLRLNAEGHSPTDCWLGLRPRSPSCAFLCVCV